MSDSRRQKEDLTPEPTYVQSDDKPQEELQKLAEDERSLEVSVKHRATSVERYLRTTWGNVGARAEGSWRSLVIEQLARAVVDRSEAAGRKAVTAAVSGASTPALEGTIQQATATARIAAEQLPVTEVVQWINDAFPGAISRYANGGSSREEIADLVGAATRPFVGTAQRAVLAAIVLRYVRGDTRSAWGVIQTETIEAGALAQSPEADDLRAGVVAYHLVLLDAHMLLAEGASQEDVRRLPVLIVESSNNIAATLAELHPRGQGIPSATLAVMREMSRTAAMTVASPREEARQMAAQLTAALKLEANPIEVCAVLSQLGGIPSSWPVNDGWSQVVLNTASALSSIVTGASDDVPSRFFNAAVALIGVDRKVDFSDGTHLEVALYVMAVMWASESLASSGVAEVLDRAPAARRAAVNLAIELGRNESTLPQGHRREMLALLVEAVGPMRLGIPQDLLRIVTAGRAIGVMATEGGSSPTGQRLKEVGRDVLDVCGVPTGADLWERSLALVSRLCPADEATHDPTASWRAPIEEMAHGRTAQPGRLDAFEQLYKGGRYGARPTALAGALFGSEDDDVLDRWTQLAERFTPARTVDELITAVGDFDPLSH